MKTPSTPALIVAAALLAPAAAPGAPLPVATLERDTPVDYAKEIVPFLRKNCFACHNENKAKADLNLETPEAMIAGGDSGPSLVPGNPMESLVFTYAAHLEDDPMPPAKNKSKAENLTPEQLGLLKLWIEQGAKGSSASLLAGPDQWRPLDGVHAIYAVAISDDGRFVACGRGNRLYLYDLRTGALAAELADQDADLTTAHLDSVHSLAFNRFGTLASGGYRTVKLWERHLNPPAVLKSGLPEVATTLASSPDGEWIAAGDGKGTIHLQNAGSKEPAPTSKHHEAAVRSLLFSPDGAALFSASDDKTVARAVLPDLKETTTVTLPSEALSLALLEEGRTLAVGGADGTIRLLALSQFASSPAEGDPPPAPREFTGHGGKVLALTALDQAGTQLLSASDDGSVRVWDLTGKQLRQLDHGAAITALAHHAATKSIATAGADGVVRLWNAENGAKLGELSGDLDLEIRRQSATLKRDLAKRVAEMRRKELAEREKSWNESREKAKAEAGKIAAAVKELEAKSAIARTGRETAQRLQREIAALAAAGDQGAVGKLQGEVKKAEEALQKAEEELSNAERAHQNAIRNSELAVRDGTKAGERFLATQAASTDADAALTVAEEALKALADAGGDEAAGAIGTVSFSPDGRTLAVTSGAAGVRLWSATTFQPLDLLPGTEASTAAHFTSRGRLAVARADKSLAEWDSPSGWSKTRQLGDTSDPEQFPDRVLALAFHPRGHLLATGCGVPSRSAQLRFWRVRDGYPEGTIEKAHQDTITGLAYSPDGSRIASSSTDRFVKIHRVESGELLEQLEGHTNQVLDVAWSADGETIASAGADHVVKLWVAAEGRQKKTESGFKKELTAVSFLGTGEGLLIGSGDPIVKAAGQNLGGVSGFIYDAAASPNGATIVAGGEDGILRVWNAADRKLLHSFPPPTSSQEDGVK